MSETTTEAPDTAPENAPAVPVDAPVDAAAPETQPAAETLPAAQETAPATPPAAKPDKRFANMTRKLADEARAREAAEARAAAAEALLQQQRGGDDAPQQRGQPQVDVETRAAQLVEQRDLNSKLAEIDNAGRQDIGADWETHKQTMTALGATKNEAFLKALAVTENAAQIFAALAEDTDELLNLLNKPPEVMGARLGRMDAKLSTPKAPLRPTSNAPRPPAPVQTSSAPATPDLNELAKGSVDDFVRQMKKDFPDSKLFASIR